MEKMVENKVSFPIKLVYGLSGQLVLIKQSIFSLLRKVLLILFKKNHHYKMLFISEIRATRSGSSAWTYRFTKD